MKKILFSCIAIATGLLANAQTVVFNVDAPTSIAGGYDLTYASGSSWGSPDLTIPSNSVVDTLVIVNDGSSSDSLGCNPLQNAAAINGNIAVVYRGNCQFGTKALMAQNAGAVAVVIINNIPGNPIGMAGGNDGTSVTIPVVMVSDVTGDTLTSHIRNGEDVVVFIGNKQGRFANDLTLKPTEIVRPKQTAMVNTLAQNASEYEIKVGSWIRNFGSTTQHNIELVCSIDLDGNNVYNNYVLTDSLQAGDSIYVALPTFTQSTYADGLYTMNYSVSASENEEFPSDNAQTASVLMNNKYLSKGSIDATTKEPTRGDNYYWFNKVCMNFADANASRLGVKGVTYSATGTRTAGLAGMLLDIKAYEWDGSNPNSLNEIAATEFSYDTDSAYKNISVDFPQGVPLTDNQNYLFCIENNLGDTIYIGTSELGFKETNNQYNTIHALYEQTDGTMSVFIDIAPSIVVETIPAAAVSVKENEESKLTAYPNPAKDEISIIVGESEISTVSIYSVDGKLVANQPASMVGNMINLDVTDIPNGSYIVTLHYANNTTHNINVVISK